MQYPSQDPTQPVTIHSALMLGVPALDEQHRSLIDALNRLIADDHAGPRSELFVEVLTQLGRELADHFRLEEHHMGRLTLPQGEAAAHVAAHGEILLQYAQLNLELMQPHRLSRLDLLVLLRGWIIDHIVSFDLGLRRHVAA